MAFKSTRNMLKKSTGYRQFKRRFYAKCKYCGSTKVGIATFDSGKASKISYGSVSFGFTCRNCDNCWIHSISLKELVSILKKLRKEDKEAD